MAQFVVMNTVQVQQVTWYAGEIVDDSQMATAPLAAAGALLFPTGNATIDAAAAAATSARKYRGANAFNCDQIMQGALNSFASTTSRGTATLAAGTVTINAPLTATSRIYLTMKDPGAGAITAFAALVAPAANRTVGPAGSFVVNAIDNAKATIGTAVCTFDWKVEG